MQWLDKCCEIVNLNNFDFLCVGMSVVVNISYFILLICSILAYCFEVSELTPLAWGEFGHFMRSFMHKV